MAILTNGYLSDGFVSSSNLYYALSAILSAQAVYTLVIWK